MTRTDHDTDTNAIFPTWKWSKLWWRKMKNNHIFSLLLPLTVSYLSLYSNLNIRIFDVMILFFVVVVVFLYIFFFLAAGRRVCVHMYILFNGLCMWWENDDDDDSLISVCLFTFTVAKIWHWNRVVAMSGRLCVPTLPYAQHTEFI